MCRRSSLWSSIMFCFSCNTPSSPGTKTSWNNTPMKSHGVTDVEWTEVHWASAQKNTRWHLLYELYSVIPVVLEQKLKTEVGLFQGCLGGIIRNRILCNVKLLLVYLLLNCLVHSYIHFTHCSMIFSYLINIQFI